RHTRFSRDWSSDVCSSDLEGTVDDLLVFARELLHPTLIEPELAEAARTPQFPELDGVLPGHGRQDPNEWGLGFEIRGSKSPHWKIGRASCRQGTAGQAGGG